MNLDLPPAEGIVPGQTGTASAASTAIFALAVLIAVKWVVAIGMAATARQQLEGTHQ